MLLTVAALGQVFIKAQKAVGHKTLLGCRYPIGKIILLRPVKSLHKLLFSWHWDLFKIFDKGVFLHITRGFPFIITADSAAFGVGGIPGDSKYFQRQGIEYAYMTRTVLNNQRVRRRRLVQKLPCNMLSPGQAVMVITLCRQPASCIRLLIFYKTRY